MIRLVKIAICFVARSGTPSPYVTYGSVHSSRVPRISSIFTKRSARPTIQQGFTRTPSWILPFFKRRKAIPNLVCGFTLIELLISLAILAILIAGIVSAFSGFTKAEAQKGAATGVLSLLETARSETLASKGGSRYGVHLDSSGATLFAGSSYAVNAPGNVVLTLDPRVELAYSLSGTGADIVFDFLSGTTVASGTITFSLPGDESVPEKTITVSPSGTMELQ